jgi:hypothetical protein
MKCIQLIQILVIVNMIMDSFYNILSFSFKFPRVVNPYNFPSASSFALREAGISGGGGRGRRK